AGCGLFALDRRRVTLIAVGVFGFVISLGLNTPAYDVLRVLLFPYRGLRAPARASMLVYLTLAALCACGWTRLMRGRSKSFTSIATLMVAALMLVEFGTRLDRWLTLPEKPAEVYQWLAAMPRSIVAEVPLARADRLDRLHDGL